MHAPPQLLLSLVRQKYWPIDGKNCAKKIVRQCVNCFRANPKIQNQIMGSLPADRVTPAPPFNVVGVDLCGPFYIKTKRIRNSPTYKAYVACFVCFVTKAIHLEIVSDLTSQSFFACLKRFIFRRGKCKTIWSDNATNFVGCSNELKMSHNLFQNELTFSDIKKYCVVAEIEWKFIPPRSPNFGGLWESAIKCFKNHLKRTTSATSFTYEEFNTYIIQIEGIMNSRPLTPMSTDPNDSEPLTPSHFLIGKPITAPAEPSYIDIPENRLDYFKRITKLTQTFWKRFSKEYLHNLQQRNKWKLEQTNVKVGDIVLLVNENVPTNTWIMGRIVETVVGPDKRVRVVIVRTNSGNLRRSISKICKLPFEC